MNWRLFVVLLVIVGAVIYVTHANVDRSRCAVHDRKAAAMALPVPNCR